MNIVHISQVQKTLKENKDHVIFIIHSKEARTALCEELQKAKCYWDDGRLATADIDHKYIPGGIRAEGRRLKHGTLGDYEAGYLPQVPRFRVVL
jgi:hypothetical protein